MPLQLGGALFDAHLEVRSRLVQHGVALLDLRQHGVEGVHEYCNLAGVRVNVRTARVVSVARHQQGGVSQRNDRLGNQAPRRRADKDGRAHAEHQDGKRNQQVLPRPLPDLRKPRGQADKSNGLALKHDAMRQNHAASIRPYMRVLVVGEPMGGLLHRPGGTIARKDVPIPRMQNRPEHVGGAAERLQGSGRALLIIEGQRAYAVLSDDSGLRIEVADQRVPEGQHVVGEERGRRHEEHSPAYQQVHAGQPAREALFGIVAHCEPPAGAAPLTDTATFNSSELSDRRLRPTGPRSTENRTRFCAIRN